MDGFPIDGGVQVDTINIRQGDSAGLQTEKPQQGIETSIATLTIAYYPEGFVEDDGEHTAMERVGEDHLGIQEGSKPLRR